MQLMWSLFVVFYQYLAPTKACLKTVFSVIQISMEIVDSKSLLEWELHVNNEGHILRCRVQLLRSISDSGKEGMS